MYAVVWNYTRQEILIREKKNQPYEIALCGTLLLQRYEAYTTTP